MKVKNVIELLKSIYPEDEELMIDWVDQTQVGATTDEQWVWAVGMMECASEGMIDMGYVQDIVNMSGAELERGKGYDY